MKPGLAAALALAAAAFAAFPSHAQDWAALTPAQREALAPLAAPWPTLSADQKRYWLALAQSYPYMDAPDQLVLHQRMREWVALTPQQRAQARQSFDEMQQVPAPERKARWEAYQHLPRHERERLAREAAPAIPQPAD